MVERSETFQIALRAGRPVLALLPALFAPGCATLVDLLGSQPATNTKVLVDSTPRGARLCFPGGREARTPAELVLASRREVRWRVALEGYESQEVILEPRLNPWLLGNVATAGLGALVDLLTGAAWKLSPRRIDVRLQPAARIPPPRVEPAPLSPPLATGESGDAAETRRGGTRRKSTLTARTEPEARAPAAPGLAGEAGRDVPAAEGAKGPGRTGSPIPAAPSRPGEASTRRFSVTLHWDPGAGGGTVAAYRIYVGRAPGEYTRVIHVPGERTSWRVEGLEPGRHYFAVTACGPNGAESPFSDDVSADVGPAEAAGDRATGAR